MEKARKESGMCLSFTHPAIASLLFLVLFYPSPMENVIYFSERGRTHSVVTKLPRGRFDGYKDSGPNAGLNILFRVKNRATVLRC